MHPVPTVTPRAKNPNKSCPSNMRPFNSRLSLLVDQAVQGTERTTGRTRRLWRLLLAFLTRDIGR
jgi:hypothetical protein